MAQSALSEIRETLALLQENGIEPSIREYLKDTATKAELQAVLVNSHDTSGTLAFKRDPRERTTERGR